MLTGDQAVNASSTGAFGDLRTMKAPNANSHPCGRPL